MSSYRQKKQLTTLENVLSLTDQELREALKQYNVAPGPITDSTRNLYRKKLASMIDEKPQAFNESLVSTNQQISSTPPPKKERISLLDVLNNDHDLEDSSDEDYNVHDEEQDSSEDIDDEDDEEEEDEDEELTDEENLELDGEMDGDLNDDVELTSSTAENTHLYNYHTKPFLAEHEKLSRRKRSRLLIFLFSLFVCILSIYLYKNYDTNFISSIPKRYTYISKLVLFIMTFVLPIGYLVHVGVNYYISRRHKEMEQVCAYVEEALHILQNPSYQDKPIPVLHIRDTLLTPAVRKSKKTMITWNKAVKFVEEHESRVKVEMVNIDGEAFRAWKWIATKKL